MIAGFSATSGIRVIDLGLLLAAMACGQTQPTAPSADGTAPESATILRRPGRDSFPHSQTSRYWISGQDNIIFQWHPSFEAAYSGPNSFRSKAEHATSNVATLFLGLQATHTTEFFVDVETADGGGVSDALGLAGFINVDVVRNPELGPTPYLARAMVRQSFR